MDLAQQDPFLKIEEIATAVETTPRYVRTILSEAGISLMQLRRNYARNMEKRLGFNVTVDSKETEGLTDALTSVGQHVGVKQVRVVKIQSPELAAMLELAETEPLLQISRVRSVNDRPFFINQVVTHKNLTVDDHVISSTKPLRKLLGLVDDTGHCAFVDRSLEVVGAEDYIASNLGLRKGAPIMKSGNVIVVGDERVGVEFNYFDAYRVKFVFTGASDYTLKIVEKL